MRLVAVLLITALVLPAQQSVQQPAQPPAAQQPGQPATAPGQPDTSQPTLGAGASATMMSDLGDLETRWTGSPAWFRKTFQSDARVLLSPPVRLKDYVVDGKLRLSLRGFLDLVVANNTDLSILRVNLEIPKNAIERAFSVFDPLVNTSFGATRSTNPATNALQGASVVSNLTQPYNFRYQQTLPTSTQVFSTLSWQKLSTNDTFALFNPAYSNNWQMGFTQPLMRNRGKYITKLPITIARAQRVQQEIAFQDSILRSLVTAENAYWDVIGSRERIVVQKDALKLAEAALERTNREIELGATSELERFQPEQNAATARINLVQVEYQLRQFEDVLRRFIGADLDPDVRQLPLELTEDVSKPPEDTAYDKEKLVSLALTRRPDLKSNLANLEVNDLQIRSAREGLKPVLNLSAFYQTFGRGGPGYTRDVPPIFVPGGPGDAWSQMFGFNYSTYNFQLTLNLPLRDHTASANLADAVVNKRLTALRERSIEQQVRQDVLTAITNVESSREGVKLALIAFDYAKKRADADQKRYDLGVINIFFLLSAQNDLTVAQSNVVNQTVTYRRNVLTLQQRLGTLLEDKGIVIQ